ncbi:MAG: tol-pal system protein YbgF [bacterium]
MNKRMIIITKMVIHCILFITIITFFNGYAQADSTTQASFPEEYKKAIAVFNNKDYEQARRLLAEFINNFSNTDLADNAQYWLGECYFAEGRFVQAINEFQNVITNYPDGNKMADATYRLGVCYEKLGDLKKANEYYDLVINKYPHSEVKKAASGKKGLYSIIMRESDLKSLLLSFSKDSEYNIIIDPDVEGKVTMDIKDMPLEKAIDNIIRPLGYVYQKEDKTIRIFRPRIETRIFTLNYLASVRTGQGTITSKSPGNSDTAGETTGGVEVTTQETTDVWRDLENGLKQMLSPEGNMLINNVSSIIVVTDYSYKLDKITKFLEAMENNLQKQVLIEATIMEVTLSDNFQMGINWDRVLDKGTHGFIQQYSFKPELIDGPLQTGIGELFFTDSDTTLLVHALSAQGNVNIISKPRITTLNNQRAVIKAGIEDVYFEEEKTINAQETDIKFKAKFFTIGVVLDVTPQIGTEDRVTLYIHPIVTEKIKEKPLPAGDFAVTVPVLSVRESSSIVKIKSGQTLVLAGLLQEKKEEVQNGLPFFSKIPILGTLFRHKSIKKEKTELVVTLTPTILTDGVSNMDKGLDVGMKM